MFPQLGGPGGPGGTSPGGPWRPPRRAASASPRSAGAECPPASAPGPLPLPPALGIGTWIRNRGIRTRHKLLPPPAASQDRDPSPVASKCESCGCPGPNAPPPLRHRWGRGPSQPVAAHLLHHEVVHLREVAGPDPPRNPRTPPPGHSSHPPPKKSRRSRQTRSQPDPPPNRSHTDQGTATNGGLRALPG